MTEDPRTEDPSKRIGDYEVLGVLGAGGMGKVFKVRNVISDRIEAMKVLLPDLAGRQELADRFLREIKLLASLDHPNIAQLRTALTLSNRLVMVMEYVEGTTLAARLEQGPIPPDELIGYTTQVLHALSYAHARSVIHRDIKPANMMLTPGGTVKLMDFGIARAKGDASMTVTGTTLGSLFYMSPEQVKGGTVDPRSDLYSLGVAIYEMVTGELPFKAGSDYSIMTAQLEERPKPPSEVRPGVPPQLNGIILHSMAKDPAERFQSADEFRQALESVRQSIPASAGAVAPAASFAPAAIPFSPTAVASTPTAATSAFNPVAARTTTSPAMAPPIPPVAPQPVPSVMQLSPAPHKGRGLYMALGAIIVVAVLVLAGLSLPRWLKTRAAEQQQKSSDQSATPDNSSQNSAQTPSSTANPPAPDNNAANPQSGSAPPPDDSGANSAPSTGSAPPVDTSAPAPDSSPSAKGKSGRKAKSMGAGDQASTASRGGASSGQDQPLSDAGSGAESIEAVEQDVDETSSRVAATTRSLDTMRRQFQSQGLGLRGDIVSAQELMNANLERAHQALQNRDAKNARRYLTIAQAQEDKIEKFLGH
jgi:eukaryotic-like serine/threonine-protein kinase